MLTTTLVSNQSIRNSTLQQNSPRQPEGHRGFHATPLLANSSASLPVSNQQARLDSFNLFDSSSLQKHPNAQNETLNLVQGDAGDSEDDENRLMIFQSFYELNKEQGDTPKEVFEKLTEFILVCENNYLFLQKMLQDQVPNKKKSSFYLKLSSLLYLEQNTWRLVLPLLAFRYENYSDGEENDLNMMMDIEEDIRLRLSDAQLIEQTLERSTSLREMQLVIDWAEGIFLSQFNSENASFDSDSSYYWENTLHNIKKASNKSFSTQTRPLCSEMDPDAPIRSNKPLDDLDKEEEARLFFRLFKMVQAGQIADAKVFAEKLGYFWLSAALEGWIAHHDPNYSQASSENRENQPDTLNNLLPITGNPYRDLWKFTAWKCSKMEGTNVYERALFAILSGNRASLLPHCNQWISKLWAYFK